MMKTHGEKSPCDRYAFCRKFKFKGAPDKVITIIFTLLFGELFVMTLEPYFLFIAAVVSVYREVGVYVYCSLLSEAALCLVEIDFPYFVFVLCSHKHCGKCCRSTLNQIAHKKLQ